MKLITEAFNNERELNEFVNKMGITKEQIVIIYPEQGMVVLHYYAED